MAKDDVTLDADYVIVGGKAVKVGSAAHTRRAKDGRRQIITKLGAKGSTVSAAVAKQYGIGAKPTTKAVAPGEDK